ncbi:MAG: response regulator [Desulfuromonadales bacterium]|nr:response regulator [Desulfuromonadales bacterium]
MKKAVILIIDDDQNQRKTLTDIVAAKGYETYVAEDGAAGLAVLQENPVNLVLTDLGLPDISGIDILSEVKSLYPDIQVIILTGMATVDSAVEATNLGAFSYLRKPYDIDQLLLQIQRAIEKQRVEEELRLSRQLLEDKVTELEATLARVKQLEGILPICMYCKKIRNDQEDWQQMEEYISQHSEANFSHGLCPECYKQQLKEFQAMKK